MTVNDAMGFPCGCKAASVNDVFVMQPCSPTCEVYAYTHTEARKQGKPISELDFRKTGELVGYVPECLECGEKLDGYTGPKGTEPEPGDLSICAYCGAVAFYTETGLRSPTPIEQNELKANQGLMALVEAVKRRGRLGKGPL